MVKIHTPARFEFLMAWRETRPALKRFVFLASIIALGVGSLTGIKGFGHAPCCRLRDISLNQRFVDGKHGLHVRSMRGDVGASKSTI